MTDEISRVAVVVPARNERALLPACLDALVAAVQQCPVPACLVLVLDDCTDDSSHYVRERTDVTAVHTSSRCVGAARALGVHAAWQLMPGIAADRVWIASTDADSVVPPVWLAHQVHLAAAGADLVLGTVDLQHTDQRSELHRHWRNAYARRYTASGGHTHIHGANLGIRGSTYLAAGGWPD